MVFTAATESTAATQRVKRLMRRARARGLRRTLYALVHRVMDSRWCRPWLTCYVVDLLAVQVADLKRTARLPSAFVVRRAEWHDRPVLESFCGPSGPSARRLARGGPGPLT